MTTFSKYRPTELQLKLRNNVFLHNTKIKNKNKKIKNIIKLEKIPTKSPFKKVTYVLCIYIILSTQNIKERQVNHVGIIGMNQLENTAINRQLG